MYNKSNNICEPCEPYVNDFAKTIHTLSICLYYIKLILVNHVNGFAKFARACSKNISFRLTTLQNINIKNSSREIFYINHSHHSLLKKITTKLLIKLLISMLMILSKSFTKSSHHSQNVFR